mmetsp:Transcript_13326/g.55827  ORF Transcript_13326/g.55827 Transcript_13326/m.55827 type:complete len:318 (+) Transcript_13326:838-1791(+)
MSASKSTEFSMHSSASSTSIDAAGGAPNTACSCLASASPMSPSSGNVTLNLTYRLPLSKGRPWTGMPSSLIFLTSPGRMISPGCVLTSSVRPSRCLMVPVYPVSASTSVISFSTMRSLPLRVKVLCSFCCSTNTMSPGTVSGASSASPRKTIFCPCRMPFSTKTSRILRCCTTLLPLHSSQRSPGAKTWPEPLHSEHTTCTCWIMPGPICLICIRAPAPPQARQVVVRPLFEPVPLHFGQIRFLLRESFFLAPLYRSSSVIFSWWTTSSPRRSLRPRELPPIPPIPPPNICSKMSNGLPPPPPGPMPSLRASSPYSS